MSKPFIQLLFFTIVISFFLNSIVVQAIEIPNPLKWNTIEELIKAIIVFLRNFAIAVTPIIIILAGYYFVTAMGDPAQILQAKKMILYALIGLLIILVSEAIVLLIEKVIKG